MWDVGVNFEPTGPRRHSPSHDIFIQTVKPEDQRVEMQNPAEPSDNPITEPAANHGQEEDEDIPPITSVVPSIFIPLRESMADPYEPPHSRVEKLRSLLASVDLHEAEVKQNLLYMFEREKRRIINECKKTEAEHGRSDTGPGLDPGEADDMIRHIQAKPRPGVDYNVLTPLRVSAELPTNPTPRQKTAFELLCLIDSAVNQLNGYQGHIGATRQEYQGYLQKEMEIEAQIGQSP